VNVRSILIWFPEYMIGGRAEADAHFSAESAIAM
jgi:hypothetical protein